MSIHLAPPPVARLPRVATGILGLDRVLDGGLIANTVHLVSGAPGTGKTTLGSQIAFHHARNGDTALIVTVLAESHERLLTRLRVFPFFAPELVGERVHVLSLADTLEEGGPDGVLAALWSEVRNLNASVLVIDGAAVIEEHCSSSMQLRRFIQQLQGLSGLAGCTTLLLAGIPLGPDHALGTHADGIIELNLDSVGVRDVRAVRIVKMRGAAHLTGRHDVALTNAGMDVFPRLEAAVGSERPESTPSDRLSTGLPVLDEMLGGGIRPYTSTTLLGTPGVGKTLLALHYLAEGVAKGERGLIVTFHENENELIEAAAGIGLDLEEPIRDGGVRVHWEPPLELSPDGWAWRLLAMVDEQQPVRVVLDGLSDVQRMIVEHQRMATFVPALMNELRNRGATTLATVEIDAYAGPELTVPLPSASATMDNGLLLRHVELKSRLHRLISVLKARHSDVDLEMREFTVSDRGLGIGGVFRDSQALLTGGLVAERPGTSQ